MLHKFVGKTVIGIFCVLLANGCSTAPNLTQAQIQTPATPPIAPVRSSEETTEAIEQTIKKFVELGFNKKLSLEEKKKQIEDCCLAEFEQPVSSKETNVVSAQRQNLAWGNAVLLGTHYERMEKLDIRCQNEQEAVVGATFQVKGKKRLTTDYFTLAKQNNKWLIKDISVLQIPNCAF